MAKTVTLYVNGVADGVFDYTGSVLTLQSSKLIGTSRPTGFPDDFFHGRIDETSIFNSALGAAEIQSLYQEGSGAGTDVVVNLVTGRATGIASGIRLIQNAIGGAGDDVLVGNGGNVLTGGGGRDLLIAGDSASQLFGGDDEDILIGGRTTLDNKPASLDAVMAEWTADSSYEERVQTLRDGLLDGTVRLNNEKNTLFGQDSLDFFYATDLDLTDRGGDEIVG